MYILLPGYRLDVLLNVVIPEMLWFIDVYNFSTWYPADHDLANSILEFVLSTALSRLHSLLLKYLTFESFMHL